MKPPSHSQVCEQRHALLCTWAARRSTQRDNGRTWLDTSKHIAAVNSAVIRSKTRAVLSQGEFFGEVKGDSGGVSEFDMTELEVDKAFSVCRWPSFSWSQCRAERPPSGEARPGQARTVPRFIVKDSYTLEMLLKTGQLRVSPWIVWIWENHTGGQKGLSRMRRLPSTSAAIHIRMYTTQGYEMTWWNEWQGWNFSQNAVVCSNNQPPS